eukprot:m.315574 g.315574  ORF g.315574 m.315574 type:complete len:83 (+) comp42170_c0_seq1:75-323(+)
MCCVCVCAVLCTVLHECTVCNKQCVQCGRSMLHVECHAMRASTLRCLNCGPELPPCSLCSHYSAALCMCLSARCLCKLQWVL